jgi:hypothetical protein
MYRHAIANGAVTHVGAPQQQDGSTPAQHTLASDLSRHTLPHPPGPRACGAGSKPAAMTISAETNELALQQRIGSLPSACSLQQAAPPPLPQSPASPLPAGQVASFQTPSMHRFHQRTTMQNAYSTAQLSGAGVLAPLVELSARVTDTLQHAVAHIALPAPAPFGPSVSAPAAATARQLNTGQQRHQRHLQLCHYSDCCPAEAAAQCRRCAASAAGSNGCAAADSVSSTDVAAESHR